MTMRIFSALLLVAGSGLLSTAHAAGDPAAGSVKAQTCLGCHGIENYHNVYPTYHVPKLGGQDAQYVVSALKAYQDGSRKHSTMQGNVAELTEQDMLDIAAYFESNAN